MFHRLWDNYDGGSVVMITVIHTEAEQYSMLTHHMVAIIKPDGSPKDSRPRVFVTRLR
ncbi:MAG: hypothetical protein WCX22_12610 [Methanoregula sp.]